MAEKRDGYKFQEKWESWKEKNFNGIKGMRKEDSKLLIEFLKDMELGLNVPKHIKGKRGAGTLLNLSSHNLFFAKHFKKPFLKLTKEDLHKLENDVINGKIKRKDGKNFTSFGNYVKDFKVFWNWALRTNKVKNNIIEDISAQTEKPAWVYLTEEEAKKFFNKLNYYYRAICWFMYDSGMRVTEANSIKVKHFDKDFRKVSIPDEVSKTFGRTINLKLCTALIKEFVKEYDLKSEDFIFRKNLPAMNKYLKENCSKMFGADEISNPKAKGKYGSFTLYDIRHNSACYWLNRYPTQKGIMYRFGWKRALMIEYYSEFLGVNDEITDADMILAEDKGKLFELEKRIKEMEKFMSPELFERLKLSDKKYPMRVVKRAIKDFPEN